MTAIIEKGMDVTKLSQAHADNVKAVYALVNTVEDLAEFQPVSNNEVSKFFNELTNIKMRDGLLVVFGTSDEGARARFRNGIEELWIHADKNKLELTDSVRANAAMISGAIAWIDSGIKMRADYPKDEIESDNDDAMSYFAVASDLGCSESLFKLLSIAISNGVPATVFTDSILLVSLEEATKPVGE